MSSGPISGRSGVSGNSESGGTLPGSSEPSAWAAVAVATASGDHHPSLLLPGFCKKEQFGPHQHFSALGPVDGCSPVLGSSFMGGLGLVTLVVPLVLLSK